MLRIGGGALEGDPMPVTTVAGDVTGLVWADDGTALAWTVADELTAAPMGSDGTPGPAEGLGTVAGWIADWNRQDEATGQLVPMTVRTRTKVGRPSLAAAASSTRSTSSRSLTFSIARVRQP